MNEIVAKFEEEKLLFIRALLEQYRQYMGTGRLEASYLRPRRNFTIYCGGCLKKSKFFDALSKSEVSCCPHCKTKIINDTL